MSLSELTQKVQQQQRRILDAARQLRITLPVDKDFNEQSLVVWRISNFVADYCYRYPENYADLYHSGDLYQEYTSDEYTDKLQKILMTVSTVSDLEIKLREFRKKEMVRIIWRDAINLTEFTTTMRELSSLADACIHHGLRKLYRWLTEELGTPAKYLDAPQDLLVIALGKLGGEELNLSSDVDLIFAYPEEGMTAGLRSVPHKTFFTRLGQQLIQLLTKITSEGIVYRVDMRLRPYGTSGALAISFSELEQYYNMQGREWERYALIKSRIISGNPLAGEHLLMILREFVYKKYLDFTAIETLRQMHGNISRFSAVKRRETDVKLGPGGIREVEFIVQTLQLIHAGDEKRLQRRRLLAVLSLLREFALLSQDAAKELSNAYLFLRKTEHYLQAVDDRQTHELPKRELDQQRLAFAMGESTWSKFIIHLNLHRDNIKKHFNQLIARPELDSILDEGKAALQGTKVFWDVESQWEEISVLLPSFELEEAKQAKKQLAELRHSPEFRRLNVQERKYLYDLIPHWIVAISKTKNPKIALNRLMALLKNLLNHGVYLALLCENPKTIEKVVDVCSRSPWITDVLIHQPILLGELIEKKRLVAAMDVRTLTKELTQIISEINTNNVEACFESLRRFKWRYTLRVAALDLTGVLPVMRVSDHLTNIATAIIDITKQLAWKWQLNRYPLPHKFQQDAFEKFVIIGYGKLGGIELGYNSDLDLVFLYDDNPELANWLLNQSEPVELDIYYTRFAQAILQLLTTKTINGALYNVDLRLRPSGEQGLLVTTLDTFANYQQTLAWVWEHQALVRARVISGGEESTQRFELIRKKILKEKRPADDLKKSVLQMRERLRAAMPKTTAGQFDLKSAPGGITDIEFIVQYVALRYAYQFPSLVRFTDNIRILDALNSNNLISGEDAKLLANAYRAYRSMAHHLDLQQHSLYLPESELASYRLGVQKVWNCLFSV